MVSLRALCFVLMVCAAFPAFADIHEEVTVQVVNLQVSVTDANGNFIGNLAPDDFQVLENNVPQEVLDLELAREPFSIGILLDTSSSMRSDFSIMARATEDFIHALQPDDEYFVMTFDDQLLLKKDFSLASQKEVPSLDTLRYGESTRLYDALESSIERLQAAHYPRRALFLVSDGLNTKGKGDLNSVIMEAQRNKVLVYSLVFNDSQWDLNALKLLTEQTGGTYFDLDSDTPRLLAAYNKIEQDLAHRFTLYYHSISDYSGNKKPTIKVQMKNPHLRVYYQKTYYP